MSSEYAADTKRLIQCKNCHGWYEEFTTHSCIITPQWTGYMRFEQ
jgi:hypothetical protein